MVNEFKISLDNKPNLSAMKAANVAKFKEVVSTFVDLMEESCDPEKGIMWADLPEKLHPDLKFRDLVRGLLRGAMDVKTMAPQAYAVLREEVHPLSILQPRKNALEGGQRVWNWKEWFALSNETDVGEQLVEEVTRKLFFHAKYINFKQLHDAYSRNQITTFKGLDAAYFLQFRPALEYQRQQFGDLKTGAMFSDIGLFNCGLATLDMATCPACNRQELTDFGRHKGCNFCNAGFFVVEEE